MGKVRALRRLRLPPNEPSQLVMRFLRRLLAHPLTRDLDVDDPRTTERRRTIIREKQFLRKVYEEWYGLIAAELPAAGSGLVVELGSGGGFLHELVQHLIRSDVILVSDLDVVLDARHLPFSPGSVRCIAMVDVLHHIRDVNAFFGEADRCLAVGGKVIMVEPWNTTWSRIIYQNLHHEPFLPETTAWALPEAGPLSGANGALPWIVFSRDLDEFRRRFPRLALVKRQPMMPFRYLLSGGVSMRSLLPGVAFGPCRALEGLLQPLGGSLAMFALIVLERTA